MNASYAAKLAVALIHHPVVDKNGQPITAAVTSLDLHDIARAARTYGLDAFYVVTPLQDQQELVTALTAHWVKGAGAKYNPDRQAALALIQLQPDLQGALDDMKRRHGQKPQTVVTSARMADSDLTFEGLRAMQQNGRPVMLLFGTAWGMAPELLAQADFRLTPIEGADGYNHLSVRSAVSIILDRTLAFR